MRILFVDDCNGHEGDDPRANLIEIDQKVKKKQLKDAEFKQAGVMRIGGSWHQILEDLGIEWSPIEEGKLSQLENSDYDLKYRVISGNY